MTELGIAVTYPQAFAVDVDSEVSAREQREAWAEATYDHLKGLGLQAVFCKTRERDGKRSPIPMAGTTGGADFGAFVMPAKGFTRPAFRLPPEAIALDVDRKPGKNVDGCITLARAEAELGMLPDTQRLTAHGFGQGSGRMLFRIPDGLIVDERFFAQFGGSIDVIRTGHRFSMAPGDLHHDSGTPVVCYGPDGTEQDLLAVDQWPMLPADWLLVLYEWSDDHPVSSAGVGDDDDEDALDRVLNRSYAQARAERALAGVAEHDTSSTGFRKGVLLPASRTIGGFIGSLYADEDAAADALADAVRKAWGSDPDGDDLGMISSGLALGASKPWIVIDDPEPVAERTLTLVKDGAQPRTVETRPKVPEAGNESIASDWLAQHIGTGPMSGLFVRGDHVVHTPQIGEDGYQSLQRVRRGEEPDPEAYDGPAQVREMTPDKLVSVLHFRYRPVKVNADGKERRINFPRQSAQIVLNSPHDLPNIRDLAGVTHTPIVRADGSILGTPGYDDGTGYLFLPMAGAGVPEVAEEPTRTERDRAREIIDDVLWDYRFTHERYRANYLTYLLTPLLRLVCPPPYPLFTFDARKPGSGKTMLAKLGHIVHGGVFRSELPVGEEEFAKEITTILSADTSPYVLFDNVKGTVRSAKLEGLLTSDEWSQRRLGGNEQEKRPNDRIWSLTANNAQLGGDLARRVLRVDINPEHAFPHLRAADSFRHADLMGHVRSNRGHLTWALLTLIRAWVVAGMPDGEAGSTTTADNYARLLKVCNGIIRRAGYEGVSGERTNDELLSEDDQELGDFLSAVWGAFGSERWMSRDVLDRGSQTALDFAEGEDELKVVPPETFPSHISLRLDDRASAVRKLGKWLSARQGRDALSTDGRWRLQVEKLTSGYTGATGVQWRVLAEPNHF